MSRKQILYRNCRHLLSEKEICWGGISFDYVTFVASYGSPAKHHKHVPIYGINFPVRDVIISPNLSAMACG